MATQTLTAKPRLVYALPTAPPIPFAAHPSYPIRLPTVDLAQAYTATLWPEKLRTRAEELAALEAFARLLVSILRDKSAAEANALFRAHLLPLQAFDKRWRSEVPAYLEDPEDQSASPATEGTEAPRARQDHERWTIAEKERLEEERKKRAKKGKERAESQEHVESGVDGEDEPLEAPLEVKSDNWVEEKELLETRLQALLLLGLLSLPATFQPDRPKKGKKKRAPELFAETLDPSMLLDFQTDRMQIWRVMQEVSDLNVAAAVADGKATAKEKEIKQLIPPKDLVQEWWADVVEPNFRTRVDAATLSHHRIKLFPASTSQADRLAQRLAPAPSPFKARSLLSLEKSARKREIKAGEQRVADSPTMKRLLRGAELAAAQQGSDTFKVPKAPRSRGGDDQNESSQPRIAGERAGRRPRDAGQLDRSRPLPRGDSTAGATEVLQRRVVSMNKKPRSAATAPKRPGPAAASVPVPVDDGEGEVVMRKRKRKSLSPKKLDGGETSTRDLVLVPDTPDKNPPTNASFRNPFARAPSPPSFAALGAAFRNRAAEAADPFASFRLQSPPPMPQRASVAAGHQRTDTDIDDEYAAGMDQEAGEEHLLTPKRPGRMLVPDT